MKMIDLSMTVTNHWRWKVDHSLPLDFEKGDEFRSSLYQIGAHAFTHVDTPLHCKPNSVTLEKLPVDAYSGPAAVIDLSYKKPNEPITEADLQENGKHVKDGEIIVLKTCWDQQFDYHSKEFWTEAPYVTDDAALWLLEKKPRAVAFDFPQDYPLKLVGKGGKLKLDENTTHKYLLNNDILHIEYLCNLGEVKSNRIQLIALPIKFEGFEGGPARVVAIEE